MTPLLLVAAGSSLGAPTRYLLDRAIQFRHERIFPWGTLAINASGSLVMGILVGVSIHRGVDPRIMSAAGTGFLGGYTTFSTFTWESLQLVEEGAVLQAMANLVASVAAGVALAAAGIGVGQAW